MSFIQLTLCLFLFSSYSEESATKINPESFDYIYLEKMVNDRINEIRKENKCEPLEMDSNLYKAAKNHTDYMVKNDVLSHFQSRNGKMETPQLRANHFGAGRYNVGENILYTYYNSNVIGRKNKRFKTYTYEILADAIIHSWMTSKGHFENMIIPEYKRSGLAISIDTKNKRVYVCQDFAKLPTFRR